MTGLPDFIVQSPPRDDPQMPPPYRFDRVLIRFFVVAARLARLQALCDRCFNSVRGSPVRIEPLADLAYIQILHYPKIYSTRPGYPELGFVTQHELVFAIPVVVHGAGLPRLGLVTPFLFVDSDRSMITGRDVIGYPKCLARFRMPQTRDALSLKVTASAPSAPRDRLSGWKNQALLTLAKGRPTVGLDTITGLGDDQARKLWPWGPVDLFGSGGLRPIDEPMHRMLQASAGVSLHSYTLKQFRDAADPMKACYQAVVRSKMVVETFHDYAPLNARIVVHEYPGLDIVDHLGIGRTIDPLLGFRYEADFTLTDVENLFVRSADSGPEAGRGPDCGALLGNMVRTTARCYLRMGRIWLDCLEELARDR